MADTARRLAMRRRLALCTSLSLLTTLAIGCGGSDDVRRSEDDDPAAPGAGGDASEAPTIEGLFDEKYFDGHFHDGEATPILPPGRWDYRATDSDLANYKNFRSKIGTFKLLDDHRAPPFGWALVGDPANAVNYAGPAAYFEGSAGADILNLGPQGKIHSFSGSLGGGPDVLVFNEAWSLDFSTSADRSGLSNDNDNDNDLIVAGCDEDPDGSFDIKGTSIHAGSGQDLIFVRDAKASGFDAGNFKGITSELDPADGDDVAVFRGNMLDFRFFGGSGDDTAIWYVDEDRKGGVWLGPNFFGGGGAGEALWGDPGVDRLVLVIPTDTEVISQGSPEPGQLLVRILGDYKKNPTWDKPTLHDPKAKYCVACGVGPGGRKTLTLEYRSAEGDIHTGYFWVTAFEELQIGLGPQANVYDLDDTIGAATLSSAKTPFEPPSIDPRYCR